MLATLAEAMVCSCRTASFDAPDARCRSPLPSVLALVYQLAQDLGFEVVEMAMGCRAPTDAAWASGDHGYSSFRRGHLGALHHWCRVRQLWHVGFKGDGAHGAYDAFELAQAHAALLATLMSGSRTSSRRLSALLFLRRLTRPKSGILGQTM